MAIWPFAPSRASKDAERLLAAVTDASRRPALYGAGRIPDTIEGRFEAAALNGALALIRLRSEAGTETLAQQFTDKFFRLFDAGLREAGVGDLTVPKRMRSLAASFYGRLDAYAVPIAAGDAPALEAALSRNALGADAPHAGALAAHVLATAQAQSQSPLDALFSPEGWPSPPA